MNSPVSKESLLRHVDALRDISRRSRKLATAMEAESDRRRLNQHADELDDNARRIEKAAVDAKTFVLAAPAGVAKK